MARLRAGLVAWLSIVLLAFQAISPASSLAATTTTPIQHVVVIFQENVSFDHYFGTYPQATNPPGEPAFHALPNTPSVNGLTPALLNNNPNSKNPQRLDASQGITCDMDHDYLPEQKAVDGGKMDKFVENTEGKNCGSVTTMDYYDGNTVTAIWNYAQNFALSDNFFDTTYGPSTPGHIDLISGQTHGATPAVITDTVANGTDIGDADPTYDDCSAGHTFAMTGKNVGDLLNAHGITWGWFQGGFKPSSVDATGKAKCAASATNIAGTKVSSYSAHHEPFQYYQSTSNPHHLPPTSVAMIGHTDQANHQYDISDFWAAADAGNLPAVSYLKAPRSQDGHPAYSDPIDEQKFVTQTVNHLESLPTWSSTAIFITWDDSDGWYDHVYMPPTSPSNDPSYDVACGTPAAGAYPDRCGPGPRLPLLAISPYAKANYVDHTQTSFASILRFVEDNWQLGQIGDQSFDANPGTLNNMFNWSSPRTATLMLDPSTGEPGTVPTTLPATGGAIPVEAFAVAGVLAILAGGFAVRRSAKR